MTVENNTNSVKKVNAQLWQNNRVKTVLEASGKTAVDFSGIWILSTKSRLRLKETGPTVKEMRNYWLLVSNY